MAGGVTKIRFGALGRRVVVNTRFMNPSGPKRPQETIRRCLRALSPEIETFLVVDSTSPTGKRRFTPISLEEVVNEIPLGDRDIAPSLEIGGTIHADVWTGFWKPKGSQLLSEFLISRIPLEPGSEYAYILEMLFPDSLGLQENPTPSTFGKAFPKAFQRLFEKKLARPMLDQVWVHLYPEVEKGGRTVLDLESIVPSLEKNLPNLKLLNLQADNYFSPQWIPLTVNDVVRFWRTPIEKVTKESRFLKSLGIGVGRIPSQKLPLVITPSVRFSKAMSFLPELAQSTFLRLDYSENYVRDVRFHQPVEDQPGRVELRFPAPAIPKLEIISMPTLPVRVIAQPNDVAQILTWFGDLTEDLRAKFGIRN